MMRTLLLLALFASGFVLLLFVTDRPLDPGRLQGWLRADALSALMLLVLASFGLSEARRHLLPVMLLSLAMLTGHLVLLSGLLVGAALLRSFKHPGGHIQERIGAKAGKGTQPNDEAFAPLPQRGRGEGGEGHPWYLKALSVVSGANVLSAHGSILILASLAAAGGLVLLGLNSGAWHYAAPMAGSGLNSLSFGLLLFAATLGSGGLDLVRGRAPHCDPLINVACLYSLLRLFSLGPWNLGWLFAAMLVGAAIVLAAAWQGAAAPPAETAAWQGAYLSGLIVTGAGLGSDAGIILATYGLLLMPVVHSSLSQPQAPHWSYWLLCGALPLSAPFIIAWLAIAAALAGGMTLLAISLWAAALLAALPVARLARSESQGQASLPPTSLQHYQTIGLSAGLALGAPLIVPKLLAPIAAQLQSGLTPFGSLELWPWAGLIAFNAARQPVATLPSLALLALMLILAALCWLGLRVGHGRSHTKSDSR